MCRILYISTDFESYCMKNIGIKVACAIVLAVLLLSLPVSAQQVYEPRPSEKPSRYQKQQIRRKYGMFIHFGINTFNDTEWSDGSLPPGSYRPDTIDAAQWIKTAKDAGMKYVILVAKHHDGFCMWDSRYTDYDVARSGNATDVVKAVARECRKQGYPSGAVLFTVGQESEPRRSESGER